MTAFVDTSAWYALLSASDTAHRPALGRFQRLIESRRAAVTTNHVVGETYTLLRRGLGAQVALQFLRQVRTDPFVRRV